MQKATRKERLQCRLLLGSLYFIETAGVFSLPASCAHPTIAMVAPTRLAFRHTQQRSALSG